MLKRLLAASSVALALGACNDPYGSSSRSLSPIPPKTMALMSEKGMGKSDPILVRLYKKESELEVWKQIGGGDYALLKTFPICRWSGQLGPKVREGDRQAPEGFYTVTPAQMNPNSSFYLSFDTGYPNAFDKAHGRTGSHLMVHGTCSSRGCYAMTDEGIAEVYALARESFSAGQRGFQVQAYPFRMTPTNFARYRNDPHMPFWKNLKQGNDHFEVTKREPKVAVCAGRYAFDTVGGECKPDPTLAPAVALKDEDDRREVAELVAKGTPSVRLVYADGGGHESFRAALPTVVGDSGSSFALLDARPRRSIGEVSRPDALAQGPSEIAMDGNERPAAKAKPSTALAEMAIAKARAGTSADAPKAAADGSPVLPDTGPARNGPGAKPGRVVLASADPEEQPLPAATLSAAEKPFYQRMLAGVFGGKQEPAEAKPAAGMTAAGAADEVAGPAAPPKRPAQTFPAARPQGAGTPERASAPAPAGKPKPQAAVESQGRHAEVKALPGAAPIGPGTGAFGRN